MTNNQIIISKRVGSAGGYMEIERTKYSQVNQIEKSYAEQSREKKEKE